MARPAEPFGLDRLVHFFVHGRRASLRIGDFAVVAVVSATRCTPRRSEYGRRNDQANSPDDHEDDAYRGKPEAVALRRGHRPIHDGTSCDCDGAKDHSCQTHGLCLHIDALAVGRGVKEARSRRLQLSSL